MALGQALAELILEDLEGGIAGQLVDYFELFGDLLDHQPGGAAILLQLEQGDRPVAWRRLDDGAYPFAPITVGKPDHGDAGDLRVLVDEILHLFGAHVLALADDDVLVSTGDDHVSVRPQHPEVPGAKVPLVVKCG